LNVADLKNICKATIIIDYQSGKLLHASGVGPFAYINDIASLDTLNETLLTFYESKCTPIFKRIELEGKKYWIFRKKVSNTLYFFIEELPYVDLALAEAN